MSLAFFPGRSGSGSQMSTRVGLALSQKCATSHLLRFLSLKCDANVDRNEVSRLKLLAFVAGLFIALHFASLSTGWQVVLGVHVLGAHSLFPAPRMQQLLGLLAPLPTNAVTPPEKRTVSLCTHDVTLRNKPCVPRLRRACYAGVGLSCHANGGRGVLKLLGQALHELPGTCHCISTQEMWVSLLSECK